MGWSLILPIIVGGIYAGFFTPTEAAVWACYLHYTRFFLHKTLKFLDLKYVFKDSLHSTCMILLLIAGSMVLGHAITTLQISDQLVKMISSYDVSQFTFIIMIMILLFILGCIFRSNISYLYCFTSIIPNC